VDRSAFFRPISVGTADALQAVMGGYRDLHVWQRAMDLVVDSYDHTNGFPRSEQYGLASQIRRAAVSIPANIAEGHCRRTTRAYLNHVSIALGSFGELQTCIEIATRLQFVSTSSSEKWIAPCDEVGRLLYGLHRSLEAKIASESDTDQPWPSLESGSARNP
jgi:four helix bundle protein